MLNSKGVVRQFNKPYYTINNLISIICVLGLIKYGAGFIALAILFKLSGYAFLILYQHYVKNRSILYFQNAGFSIRRLYLRSFGADMIRFLLLGLITIFILHGIKS
ncbi:hypothetical protein ACFQZX_10120 [Mucilaginibacter litoreus]|uniref:Uncharacterized protein n=1 Tax=Mucilaginibacter litoreus TaxID=1048221 RepID=A0ABW3AST7_9SPHI